MSKDDMTTAELLNEDPNAEKPTTDTKDPKQKIHPEQAQEQIDLLLGFYEIYPDDIDSKEQKSAVKTTINRIKRAIINGRIEVSDGEEGLRVNQHTTHTENKTTFTYGEITGAHRRQLDKVGTDDGIKRMHTILSLLSKFPINEFSKLKGPDASISESLAALFLLV